MTFLDKYDRTDQIKHWKGNMEADYYLYTTGRAGERFFAKLRDEGKILGAKCENCNITYVPPRVYCERCYNDLADSFVNVGPEGKVRTFTVARIDKDDDKLDTPQIFAIIKLEPEKANTTGFFHTLGQIEPAEVTMGMRVKAVFKKREEREGKIGDIRYFKPV